MHVGFQCIARNVHREENVHRDSVFPFDGLYEKRRKKRGKKSKPFHAYVVSFPPPLCAYCQRRFTNSKKLLSNVTSVTVIHCYYTYLVRQCAWRFAREAACRSTEEEE